MKNALALAVLALAVLVSTLARPGDAQTAPPQKIGWFDFDRTFGETRASAAFLAATEHRRIEGQKMMEAALKAIEKEKEALAADRRGGKTPQAVLDARQLEIAKKYDVLREDTQERHNLRENEVAEARKQLLQQARAHVEAIAKQRGYAFILDRTAVHVAPAEFDITDEVNRRVDAFAGEKPKGK